MNAEPKTHFVLEIFLHDGRYHGIPDWPPAPGRVFQALVAGSSRGAEIDSRDLELIGWIEQLEAPLVGAPSACRGQEVRLWVPNNDLDARGGDPDNTADIRTQKKVKPWIFDRDVPFLYVWRLNDPPDGVDQRLPKLAERLYQLGRGVDMAWARLTLVREDEVNARLQQYPGTCHLPSPSGRGIGLDVPMIGSLASLQARFRAHSTRFEARKDGATAVTVFAQPPKPRFARKQYNAKSIQQLYELEVAGRPGRLGVVPLAKACTFAHQVRDYAAARLRNACPELSAPVERSLVGRETEGRTAPPDHRVRIVPLPSIGHSMVDRGIRRVFIEVPAACELRAEDVFWAFSGLDVLGEPGSASLRLVAAQGLEMLEHYGVGNSATARLTTTLIRVPFSSISNDIGIGETTHWQSSRIISE